MAMVCSTCRCTHWVYCGWRGRLSERGVTRSTCTHAYAQLRCDTSPTSSSLTGCAPGCHLRDLATSSCCGC